MWLILKSILGSRNHYHSYFTDGEAEARASWIRYRLDKGPLVGLPRCHSGQECACQRRNHKRGRFDLWVRKISWPTRSSISYLDNSLDRGAWQATVHGVGKSQTWLSIHTRIPLVGSKAKIWTESLDIHTLPYQLLSCCSVAKLWPALWDPMDCSMPGFLSSTVSQSLLKFVSTE